MSLRRPALAVAIAAAMAAPAARADGPAYPLVDGSHWMHGLAADEAGTLWSTDGGHLVELRRGAAAPCTHQSDVWAARHVFASTAGAVVTDDDGDDVAWRLGKDHRHVDLDRSLGTPAAVWIDAEGRPVIVTRTSGVAVWTGAGWQRTAYPDPTLLADAVTPGDPGEIWILLRRREPGAKPELGRDFPPAAGPIRLFRHAAGALVERDLPSPLPDRLAKADTLLAWYSRDTGTLWVATGDRALAPICLRKACPIKITEVSVFGSIQVMTGATLPGGDVVALGAQSEAALVHRGQYDVIHVPVFPEGFHLAPWDGVLYVASRDGFVSAPLPSSLTQGSPPPPSPLPDPCASTRFPEPPRSQEPWSPSPLPLQDVPPPSSRERGVDDNLPLPSLRLALGPRLTMAPDLPADWGLGFDLLAGIHSAPDPDNHDATSGYRIFAGYSHDAELGAGHRGVLGGAFTYGYAFGELELGARLLAGTSEGQAAFGLGESLGASAFWGVLGVEIDHQVLFTDRGEINDVGVMVTSEVMLLGLAVLLGGAL